MTTITTPLISIGNSKGIRIPKTLINLYRLDEGINITANRKGLLITPNFKPRQNWEELFAKAITENPSEGEKEFAFQENYFDKEEWVW